MNASPDQEQYNDNLREKRVVVIDPDQDLYEILFVAIVESYCVPTDGSSLPIEKTGISANFQFFGPRFEQQPYLAAR
jgi:hypothetical protein